MATIQHSILTGSEIHEPKGLDTATADTVYVADGAGGGDWKTSYTAGSEDDNHAGAAQSLGVGFASRTYLLNDAAGAFTTSANRLPGRADAWDPSANEFIWGTAGYQLGDHFLLRLDVDITTTGANRVVDSGIELAIGGSAYTLQFDSLTIKSASTLSNHIVLMKWDLGDANTLNNTAKVFMYSDGAGDSVQLNGWRLFMDPKNPVYL